MLLKETGIAFSFFFIPSLFFCCLPPLSWQHLFTHSCLSLLHYFLTLFFSSTTYLLLHLPIYLQLSKYPCFSYHFFSLSLFPYLSYQPFDNNYTSPDTSLLSSIQSHLPSSFLSTHVSATTCFSPFFAPITYQQFYYYYASIDTDLFILTLLFLSRFSFQLPKYSCLCYYWLLHFFLLFSITGLSNVTCLFSQFLLIYIIPVQFF